MITPKIARENFELWLENDMSYIYRVIDREITNNYRRHNHRSIVDLSFYLNRREKIFLQSVLDNYRQEGWNIRRAFPYFLNRFVFTERKNDG